jgi:hypothetical protein
VGIGLPRKGGRVNSASDGRLVELRIRGPHARRVVANEMEFRDRRLALRHSSLVVVVALPQFVGHVCLAVTMLGCRDRTGRVPWQLVAELEQEVNKRPTNS